MTARKAKKDVRAGMQMLGNMFDKMAEEYLGK